MIAELIPTLAAAEAEANGQQGRGRWRPRCSESGTQRCVRASVYHALGAKPAPFPGRTLLVFEDGDWHEEITLDRLSRTAYRVHSREMAVDPFTVVGTHEGYHCTGKKGCGAHVPPGGVHGHIDAIVTDPTGREYILEHKSASRFSFDRWAAGKEVPWDYVTQAAMYVVGARRIGLDVTDQAILLIKNKDTAAMMEYVIRAPSEVGPNEAATEIVSTTVMVGEHPEEIPLPDEMRRHPRLLGGALERFGQIAACRDGRTLPDRPFEYGYWLCNYCPFAAECWRGYKEDAAAAQERAGLSLDGDDADLIRASLAAGQAQRSAERANDELRSRIKVRLMALGVRLATVPTANGAIEARLTMQERHKLDEDRIPEDILKRATVVTTSEILNVRAKKG